MFTEGLVTVANAWKSPKCPSIEDWTKRRLYTYAWNITQP